MVSQILLVSIKMICKYFKVLLASPKSDSNRANSEQKIVLDIVLAIKP